MAEVGQVSGVPTSNNPDREIRSRVTGNAWHPSENQKRFADYMYDMGFSCTIKEALKAIGVTGNRLWMWSQADGFRQWWLEKVERYFCSRLPDLYADLFKIALEADAGRRRVNAHRLILERFDKRYMPQTKNVEEVSGTLTIEQAIQKFNAAVTGHDEKARLTAECAAHTQELDWLDDEGADAANGPDSGAVGSDPTEL